MIVFLGVFCDWEYVGLDFVDSFSYGFVQENAGFKSMCTIPGHTGHPAASSLTAGLGVSVFCLVLLDNDSDNGLLLFQFSVSEIILFYFLLRYNLLLLNPILVVLKVSYCIVLN